MVLISVLCPHCHSDQVIKGGKTKAGQQRYKCQNTDCPRSNEVISLYSFLRFRWRSRDRLNSPVFEDIGLTI
jgi:transposase-like protein